MAKKNFWVPNSNLKKNIANFCSSIFQRSIDQKDFDLSERSKHTKYFKFFKFSKNFQKSAKNGCVPPNCRSFDLQAEILAKKSKKKLFAPQNQMFRIILSFHTYRTFFKHINYSGFFTSRATTSWKLTISAIFTKMVFWGENQ